MKRLWIGIAALMVVAGCSENPEIELAATCNAVMADPEVQGDVRSANISVEDYCACAAPAILALPEQEREETVDAFESMETLMSAHNGSAEAAFETLSEARRADGATPEDIAAYEAMDALGERLEDLLDEMKDVGGTCPF